MLLPQPIKNSTRYPWLTKPTNTLLFLSNITLLAIGAYLVFVTQDQGFFQIMFILIGAFQLISTFTSIIHPLLRKNATALTIIMVVLTIIQLNITIIAAVYKDFIVSHAGENYSYDIDLRESFERGIYKQVNTAVYCAIGCASVQVIGVSILLWLRKGKPVEEDLEKRLREDTREGSVHDHFEEEQSLGALIMLD